MIGDYAQKTSLLAPELKETTDPRTRWQALHPAPPQTGADPIYITRSQREEVT
jgi:hypothetical protein